MIHTYNITGMSCDGCRSNVEKALNTINGIEASVTLDPPMATITMQKNITTSELQKALTNAGGGYTISVADPNDKTTLTSESSKTKSCCGGK